MRASLRFSPILLVLTVALSVAAPAVADVCNLQGVDIGRFQAKCVAPLAPDRELLIAHYRHMSTRKPYIVVREFRVLGPDRKELLAEAYFGVALTSSSAGTPITLGALCGHSLRSGWLAERIDAARRQKKFFEFEELSIEAIFPAPVPGRSNYPDVPSSFAIRAGAAPFPLFTAPTPLVSGRMTCKAVLE